MPDNLKKHGNICHSAGPRKVPRWEAGNRVTVGTSEKSLPLWRPHNCSGKRTLLLFILPRHVAPFPPLLRGGWLGCHVSDSLPFASRGQPRHQGLGISAVLIRRLPEMAGTNGGRHPGGWGQAFHRGQTICVRKEIM